MLAIVEPDDLDEVARHLRAVGGAGHRGRAGSPRGRAAAHPRRLRRRGAGRRARPRRCTTPRRSTTGPCGRRRPRADETDPARSRRAGGRRRGRPARPCSPTPRWVWRQYDHQLFLNTVEGPGGDATVLRLKHPVTGEDTGRALALTTDGNHRWCAVDPRAGTAPRGGRVGAQPGLRRRPAARRRQLPQLRQPRAPRGDVAAVRGHRRHGRGVPRPRRPGRRRQRQPLQRDPRARHRPDAGHRRARHRRPARAAAARASGSSRAGWWCSSVRSRPGAGPGFPVGVGARGAWGRARRRSTRAPPRRRRVVRGLVPDGVLTGLHDVADGGLALALAEVAVPAHVGFTGAVIVDGTACSRSRRAESSCAWSADRVAAVGQRARGRRSPQRPRSRRR